MDTKSLGIKRERTINSLETAVLETIKHFISHDKSKLINGLYDQLMQEIEPPLLQFVMEKCRNNQYRAAKILGLSRSTVRKKLLRYFGTRYFRLTIDN